MRSKRTLTKIAVAVSALVVAVGGACGGDDSDDDGVGDDPAVVLDGEWTTIGGTTITYSEDGRWSAQHPDYYDGEPFDRGAFSFDGEVIEYATDEGSLSCSGGQTGAYETTFTGDGELELDKIEDPCSGRSSDFFGGLVRASN